MVISYYNKLIIEAKNLGNSEKKKVFTRFFKTGVGEYGEGDVFIGLTVPECRKIAKKYYESLNFSDIKILLDSEIHEIRLIGLEILCFIFENPSQKEEVFNFLMENLHSMNNWDLVDLTAPYIIGEFLIKSKRDILYKLAVSENLWEKRISIVSTHAFIKKNDFSDCLKISKILLEDKHDLIQKAVGWMLREVGKRDSEKLLDFLKENYTEISRTTLRYAIERFTKDKRDKMLKGIFDENL